MPSSAGQKDTIDVAINDIQLHAQQPCNPKSWLQQLLRMHHDGKPRRAYGTLRYHEDGTVVTCELRLPKKDTELLKELGAQGKRIRLVLPEGGIPIYLSQDAQEKLNAEERKE